MKLSNELISEFAKITNDSKDTKGDTIVYGEIEKSGNDLYVVLDGTNKSSDGTYDHKLKVVQNLSTTTDLDNGDRVTVMIKNHAAIVTGNFSSPAVRTHDERLVSLEGYNNRLVAAEATIGEINANYISASTVAANYATINKLTTAEGRIDALESKTITADGAIIKNLQADNVTIKETLSVQNGKIEDLETNSLTADSAEIKDLQSDNVTINEKLDAQSARIENLTGRIAKFEEIGTDKLNAALGIIDSLDTTYATIDTLESEYLKTEVAEATYSKIGHLHADYATINDLQANYASIANLDSAVGRISTLESETADIDSLESEVARIDTLLFESASGDTVSSNFSNTVISQVGDAQIKSAMIDTVSADKITAGKILTNNVSIQSDDSDTPNMLIADETIQIKDSGKTVRVQIGKDASNDYSINVWDVNGNLMFSKGGITESAIKNAIIRDDMVSANANISASKLNVDSLFTVINDSSKTINASKVYLDAEDQVLSAAFTSILESVDELGTAVSEHEETISSHGTQISMIQGQISSKVWQQDIATVANELGETTNTLSTNHSSLVQEVDGISATVASHTTQINNKADSSTVTTVNNKVATLESDVSGFKTTVNNTCATKSSLNAVSDRVSTAETNIIQNANAIEQRATKVELETAVDGISIGGRNLLKGSSDSEKSVDRNLDYQTWDVPESGSPVVFSIWLKADKVGSVRMYWNDDSANNMITCPFYHNGQSTYDIALPVTTEYTKYVVYGTFNRNNNFSIDKLPHFRMRVYANAAGVILTGKMAKLEVGTKATDWCLAREEMATASEVSSLTTRMTSAETSISQTTESLKLTATKTEVETAKSAAIAAASADATTKANNALSSANTNTANSLQSYSTTEQMNSAIELKADSITSSVSNTYATKSTVNGLTSRMSSAETKIDQHDDSLKLTATKTEVATAKSEAISAASSDATTKANNALSSANTNTANSLKSYSTTAQMNSAIDLKADSITSSVSKTYATKTEVSDSIDSIEVGGRNLLKNSASRAEWTTGRFTSIQVNGILAPYIGREICVSFDCKLNESGVEGRAIQVYKYQGSGISIADTYTFNPTKEYKRYSFVTTVHESSIPTGYSTGSIGFYDYGGTNDYTIKNVKIELGNKPTEWSPAPEDMATNAALESVNTRVTNAESSIAQHADQIALRATKTEVSTAKSEAISAASADATTKANNALNSANTNTTNKLKDYSTTAQMNAAIDLKADSITSSVSSTYATKSALATTETKAASANTYTENAKSNYGYQYKYTITLNGDSSTYYPVVLRGGNQNIPRELFVWRTYSDKCPSDWNGHPDAKGISLLLKIKCNFGGWGGANYSWCIHDLEEYYGNVFAGAGHCMSNMGFYLYLRGGGTTGAVYRIYSDQALEVSMMNGTAPSVYYNSDRIGWSGGTSDSPTYSWNAPAPTTRTEARAAAIAKKKYITLTQDLDTRVSSAETKITQNANSITSVASRTTATEQSITTLEQTADGLTARIGTAETNINTAQSTANTAKTNAATAQSTANTAKTNAATAQTTADAAKTAAAAAQTTADAAKKQVYHSATGTNGTTGYIGVCTLTVKGSYQNRPILFEFANRGQQSSKVSWCFSNVNNSDPTLLHLQNDGGMKFWAYKTATSTWTLIVQKSEAYDGVSVTDFTNTNGNVAVAWTNVHYSSLPTSNVTAATVLAGKLAKSVVDDAAKTATNYLNFSSAGLVVGDHTGSTLGKNLLIDSDSVDIRNGTTKLASFTENEIDLGIASENSKIRLCGGAATISAFRPSGGTLFDAARIDTREFDVYSEDIFYYTGSDAIDDTDSDITAYTHMGARSLNGSTPEASNYLSATYDYPEGKRDTVLTLHADAEGVYSQLTAREYTVGAAWVDGKILVEKDLIEFTVANTVYKPYIRKGDSLSFTIRTSGYVTNSMTEIHFHVPLTKPVIGSPTVTASSVSGIISRQENKYTHGSTASVYAKPTSYSAGLVSDTGIWVKAVFSTTTNALNNAPCGVCWSGKLTFS